MAERIRRALACAGACVMLLFPVLSRSDGAFPVESLTGEEWYPSREKWTYRYIYSSPQIAPAGEDAVALRINDTLLMVLDEMRLLALPMFAESAQMTEDGPVTVTEEGRVMCNDGRFFSVLKVKSEEKSSGTLWSLESDTFDVGGDYPGETLTLRGVVMVGDSSDQIAAAVMPALYEAFVRLQGEGICRAEITREMFYENVIPTLDFYTDGSGGAVFYFQPSLLSVPGPDVPTFAFSPAQLEELIAALPPGQTEN